MRSGLFNSRQADLGCHLARTALPRAPHCATSAGASVPRASAALSSESRTPPPVRVEAAPVVTPPATGAVLLSSHAMVLLRAVAAYERCDNGHAMTIALADYVHKIGAGPLARAVLDAERTHTIPERVDGGGGNAAVPAALLDGEDIAGVPEYRRIGETRFPKGGGP